MEPLRRHISRRRYIVPTAGLAVAVRHQCTGSAGAAIEEPLAINHPALDTVVRALHMRNTVAPTVFRKTPGPQIRRLLNMIVDADQAVFKLHGNAAFNGFCPSLWTRSRRRLRRFRRAAYAGLPAAHRQSRARWIPMSADRRKRRGENPTPT